MPRGLKAARPSSIGFCCATPETMDNSTEHLDPLAPRARRPQHAQAAARSTRCHASALPRAAALHRSGDAWRRRGDRRGDRARARASLAGRPAVVQSRPGLIATLSAPRRGRAGCAAAGRGRARVRRRRRRRARVAARRRPRRRQTLPPQGHPNELAVGRREKRRRARGEQTAAVETAADHERVGDRARRRRRSPKRRRPTSTAALHHWSADPKGTLLSGWSALEGSAFASERRAEHHRRRRHAAGAHSISQPACPEGAPAPQCATGTPGQLTAADEFVKTTLATITATDHLPRTRAGRCDVRERGRRRRRRNSGRVIDRDARHPAPRGRSCSRRSQRRAHARRGFQPDFTQQSLEELLH